MIMFTTVFSMTVTDISSSLLERPHTMQVLLHLRKYRTLPLMEAPSQIKVDRSALERRIHELAVAGLIKIVMDKNAKRRPNVSLTPFGRDVIERFVRIERY